MGRTIVVGGGIAGTATALALHKAGFGVEVHEAHPHGAEDIGAFLTLASNGMRALAGIDASAAVTAIGFPLTRMRVLDASGAELADRPLGEADDPLLRFRCVRRGALNAALQAEVARRGIPVRHGARLVSVEEGPDAVTARFADGTEASGDLLVGADGLRSTVRRLVAPAARPLHAGQRVFYGYTADAAPAGESDTMTMVRGSAAAFGCAVSPQGESYWFARVAGGALGPEELGAGASGRWRDLLVPLLREDAAFAAETVAATGGIMATDATEMPLGTAWHSGRTLIVGDAAHAASPATGQGASMALEDAVVLAKALRDAPDTAAALEVYEALRRPRVEHNITVSGAMSRAASAPPAPGRDGRAAPGPGGRGAPPARPGEDELARVLEWDAPLPAGTAR
ncbi:FAD-dependent oxidoreductase, partial [Streptomyces fuscigenes]|uniref:FAD-dependent oxidoreductase n=1 Tax=Streptomyces fuscigenes TaxID=1528880 RepID=UPI001F2EA559